MSVDNPTYDQLRCAVLLLFRQSDFKAECNGVDWTAPYVVEALVDAGIIDWGGHGFVATDLGTAIYQALVIGQDSPTLRALCSS